jgi:protein phosphatase
MHWEQKVEYAALSDIGLRRRNNQDSYVVQTAPDRAFWNEHGHLFLVADGMGGHAVGELASKLAADTVPLTFQKQRELELPDALRTSLELANKSIYERGLQNRDFLRMGTTCTTLVLASQGAVVAHIGDSRAYRIRGEIIEQITFDHSLQWELIRQGAMTREEVLEREPRNVITRCLGPEPRVHVDTEGPFPVLPGDVYILCSDGLHGLVSDAEIGMIGRELSPADACQLLVDLANLRGGNDNITVVVAKVGSLPPGFVSPSTIEFEMPKQGLGWGWLFAVWIEGLAIVMGIALWLLDHRAEGAFVLGLGCIGLAALGLAGMRIRGNLSQPAEGSTSRKHGSPYRTASAHLTRHFLTELEKYEFDLQLAAQDEEWPVVWPVHAEHRREAKVALEEKGWGAGLRSLGKALHTLLAGLQQARKAGESVSRKPGNRDRG